MASSCLHGGKQSLTMSRKKKHVYALLTSWDLRADEMLESHMPEDTIQAYLIELRPHSCWNCGT